MNHLTATVTALAVLAHAVLGCCATHAHAADAHAEGCGIERQHDCAAQSGPLLASDASSHEHAPADAPRGCSHQRCHWASPDGGPAKQLCGILLATDACASARAATDSHFVSPTARHSHDAPSTLPVRLHLAKSVLLI